MRFRIVLTILFLISSIPSFASQPWNSLLINDRKVTLNLKKQHPANVSSWFMKATGIVIITDPTFDKQITLFSPVKVSLSDCFNMYNKVLEMYNYELVKENKWLVIKQKVRQNFAPLNNSQETVKEEVTELKVIQLKNNNAANIAKIINEIFAPKINVNDLLNRIKSNDTVRPGGQN